MYSKKTKFYQIPYQGYGDMMTQEDNTIQMSIIDNLLYAATFGADKCIIQDGKYQIQQNSQKPNYYRLKISPLSGNHSLIGILNYRLFDKKGNSYSNYFIKGEYYYFYVCYSSDLQIDPQSFWIQYSLMDNQLDQTKIKICQVDFTGEKPIINTDVDKVLAKNILAHTQDRTNPHGKELVQDKIQVLNKLILNGQQIYQVFYQKLKTNGLLGVNWSKEGYKPIYVNVYGEEYIGQVYWKINEDNSVTIYNTGQNDKNINVRIQVQKL